MCCCFKIVIASEGVPSGIVYYPEDTGRTFDNICVYTYVSEGFSWYIWRDPIAGWKITKTLEGQPTSLGDVFAISSDLVDCPVEISWTSQEPYIGFVVTTFEICCAPQERIKVEYKSIKLPVVVTEEDRGEQFKCCEVNKVLAHPTENESYKNDVTSAWIKLSDITDTITFTLEKDGIDTGMILQEMAFPLEPNAYHTTIYWQDIINAYGIGCYKIRLQYSISGILGDFYWGVYDLQQYSISNALKTARIRVKFNLNQTIEGINFTNSNVEDSIRFYGFIGNRQPNMEIDNLIYNDRSVKTVVRENLNTYEIKTDPYTNETIKRLTDLYLLSENECYISDYNEFNNDYTIQDLPVVVKESPEIDYLEKYQRKAVLNCVVSDKYKNKRSYY